MTENKKKSILRFFKNLIIYTLIFSGAYFLYNSGNKDPRNLPHTDFSFVYAQF
jgi:hypothetical protein